MLAIPIVILLTGAVGLGVYMGLRYLRRLRNKPTIIGLHFLLGAGVLEPALIAMRGGMGGPLKQISFASALGVTFVGLALVTGITAVMIGRKSRQTADIALATHVGVAAIAFVLIMTWAISVWRA